MTVVNNCRQSRIDLMAIADKSLTRWGVPVLLFTGAFIGAVIFAAAHKHSADEPRNPATLATGAPPSHSESRVVDSAGDTSRVASRENAALQKPGPPDPAAEKAAADSAARAADAAAELAASTAAPTN
jgi:hypothetical protein